MNSQIGLHYLVEHCKQLPTYKDARPIIELIQEWGADNDALSASALAVREIREYFRLMNPPIDTTEPRKQSQITFVLPEMPEFRFFSGVSDDKATDFKELLRQCIAKIDTDGKKEWFCLYAAWRYYKQEREKGGGFVDFFTDIDALFPGLLKDVRSDLPGNRRLKPYCDMLSYEYKLWAVDNGKLPPRQVWAHSDWTRLYKNSKDTIKHMQALIRAFYAEIANLLK